MNKSMLVLIVLSSLCAGNALAAQEKTATPAKKINIIKDFATMPEALSETAPLNGKIHFKLKFRCPEHYQAAGWGAVLYKPNGPADFEARTGLTPSKSKDPKWISYNVSKFSFFAPKTFDPAKAELEIDLKKWPAGDYALSVTVLYREKKNPQTKTDVYRAGELGFTIE